MKHLNEVNETYLQHATFALKGVLELLVIVATLAIHAVCPWWFTRTASTRMRGLLERMLARYDRGDSRTKPPARAP